MIRNGVKTRIALEHTCGLEGAIPNDDNYWIRQDKNKFKPPKDPLFPREDLEPAYHEFVAKYSTSPNPSAHEFFISLLKQSKTT